VIEAEGLKLDPVSHRITADDRPVEMGPTEYRLLAFFMSHQERAYSRSPTAHREAETAKAHRG